MVTIRPYKMEFRKKKNIGIRQDVGLDWANEDDRVNSQDNRGHNSDSKNILKNQGLREKNSRRKNETEVETKPTDGTISGTEGEKPVRNFCHKFFIAVQTIAILGNFCMISAEIIPIVMSTTVDFLQVILA